ncbi:SAVED domain-containing protein [Cryobacterium sp. Y57]|uniref:SAVED domain-containing protein n=1 Tax=Cryobacterium sp. Y57 TaxID=2048287 RepID=UPI000CE4D4F1|nr:SAVED domain-containing protein [Cryobacterium sp. Y57]
MTQLEATELNPSDPVFLSYRQCDGTLITTELAWILRAAGIPVWRDQDDLPPGDTIERLKQAIADGLSGAVLIVTEDVANSEVVKFTESPLLIELHKKDSAFALAIANDLLVNDQIDYAAPDRLLAKQAGTLKGVDQQTSNREGLLTLAKKLLWHRMALHRTLVATQGRFSLSVQTRNMAQSLDRTGGQLDIRLRRSLHEKLPSPQGLRDLQDTLAFLPDAVVRAGAPSVQIRGGAHLSIAYSIGAALPSSRVGEIEIIDQRDESWKSTSESIQNGLALATRPAVVNPVKPPNTNRPRVAVYVDLLSQPSPAAFERFLEEHQSSFHAWVHIEPNSRETLLNPGQAGDLAASIMAQMRELSGAHSNAEVHLLLRCPFPIAVLLGRLSNTLTTVVYEWDDVFDDEAADFRPIYVPTLRIRPSGAAGAITEVLLPAA